jgi:transcriptional regulator with XRE-family HTH domain
LVRATEREQQRLGEKLRELRKMKGFSQEAAAERIGMSTKQLGRLERGEANVTLATLVACAVTYKVEMAELFMKGAR